MKSLASSLNFEQRIASSRFGSQQQPDDFLEKLVKENIRGTLKEKHYLKIYLQPNLSVSRQMKHQLNLA